MTINHHLDDATLLAYAAGTLDESMSVVVSSHIAMCPRCRAAARHGNHLGGALMEEIRPEPMRSGALDRMMRRIRRTGGVAVLAHRRKARPVDAAADSLPLPLARRLGMPLSEIRWRRIAPGVHSHNLPLAPSAGGKLCLMRIARGSRLPEHGHGGSEMTLILRGSYSDELGRFAAGDVADLDTDTEHQPVVDSDEDCICLVALEAPARFKGAFARLLQPFVGI